MARFFFGLGGVKNVNDPEGLVFQHEIDAFRAAQRLAVELSSIRPELREKACVVVTRDDCASAYYVSL
jgi:hypothetical protein